MSTLNIHYALEPASFRSMREAQDLANTLEDNLAERSLGAANVRADLVEIFSELVNNAAEPGTTEDGPSAMVHVLGSPCPDIFRTGPQFRSPSPGPAPPVQPRRTPRLEPGNGPCRRPRKTGPMGRPEAN